MDKVIQGMYYKAIHGDRTIKYKVLTDLVPFKHKEDVYLTKGTMGWYIKVEGMDMEMFMRTDSRILALSEEDDRANLLEDMEEIFNG